MFSLRAISRPLGPATAAQFTRHIIVGSSAAARPTRLGVASMSTISEAVTRDHRELEECYNQIISSNDADHQQRYGNQFTWELARHSVGEELVLYPAFEKHLGSAGRDMAESDRKDHHHVKLALKEFQNMSSDHPEYVPKIKTLWAKLSEHVADEEKHDLPMLEDKLSPEESEAMARSFGRTKAFVPSRSHPSAGEHPPFETVMGLLTAPIDHLADLFRKFPDKKISPNPSTK